LETVDIYATKLFYVQPALFASLLLLLAGAKNKEKKHIKTSASTRHITNLKQSILETVDIYVTKLFYVQPALFASLLLLLAGAKK
jgi:hypothetical protein